MDDGYYVIFNEEHEEYNVANVRKEVGEALDASDEHPTISEYNEPDNETDE